MYPDQNQYSIDYLNQIAPQQKKPAMGNKLFFLLIGGGLLVAIIVGIFLLSGGSSGPTKQLQTLAARLKTVEKIASDSQRTIKSGSLRGINSNLSISLTNINREIATPLKNSGINPEQIDQAIVKKEAGTELTKTLEDARLNAVFDRTYARELGYQLETVTALLKELYAKTNSKSLKEFLEKTDTSLRSIKEQLNTFNTTTS